MFKIDVISETLPNKNNISEIKNFNFGIIRCIFDKSDIQLINYIVNSDSNYILFINKKEKLGKNFFNSVVRRAGLDNDFMSIISTADNPRLNITGKLIPTNLLKEYIIDKNITKITSETMNFLMYISKVLKTSKTTFESNEYIGYKKSISNLCDTLLELESLEEKLIKYNIYNEEEFSKIYIETIFHKYEKIRESFSINKPNGLNSLILYSLIYIYTSKFKDNSKIYNHVNGKYFLNDLHFEDIEYSNVLEFIDEIGKKINIKKTEENSDQFKSTTSINKSKIKSFYSKLI